VRPIAAAEELIACPVDGCVSECGAIDGERLLQAKGQTYTLGELLAGSAGAERFHGGSFATIYLAPFNYHRIHMPLAGTLRGTVFVPGRLFSVNGATARQVPRLFARNERVITLFETAAGSMAVVLVGALNVGSISTVWAGDIAPAKRRIVTPLQYPAIDLAKGAELGRFNMGSTVVLLFEPRRATLAPHLVAGRIVQLGEAIGRVLPS
jgi:phosphatidylserine decarboxylase